MCYDHKCVNVDGVLAKNYCQNDCHNVGVGYSIRIRYVNDDDDDDN